jgi:hypothetical protein
MPPWLDWLDWLKWDCIGAEVIGKILGLWFRACAAVASKLLRFAFGPRKYISGYVLNRTSFEFRTPSGVASLIRKIKRIVVATFSLFPIWAALTWKPLWTSIGLRGERILAAILLLASAFWFISLIWICFSKPSKRVSDQALLKTQRP